jgi:hypothetical protein
LKTLGKNVKSSYHKITNLAAGKKLAENVANLMENPFNVIVYNFVDMLSHARTEMEVIRELAEDDAAYRSITLSWFEHSPLLDILRNIAERGGRVVITTDHGTVRVDPAQQSGGRPQHQHQPALQARPQPHLRGQGRVGHQGPRPRPSCRGPM